MPYYQIVRRGDAPAGLFSVLSLKKRTVCDYAITNSATAHITNDIKPITTATLAGL